MVTRWLRLLSPRMGRIEIQMGVEMGTAMEACPNIFCAVRRSPDDRRRMAGEGMARHGAAPFGNFVALFLRQPHRAVEADGFSVEHDVFHHLPRHQGEFGRAAQAGREGRGFAQCVLHFDG